MDGDPREEGDSIVCHIYSIVCSLDVLRRLGWLSLGGFKCGINVLEGAFLVPESDFRHSQDCALFGSKGTQGRAYRRILRAKAYLTSPYCTQFDFSSDLIDF